MSVDLAKNGAAMKKAYDEVCNGSSSTNWVIFGYEGKTDALKVVGTGEDGLEECVQEFNPGQVQYAYVRVIDPNSQNNKFVLINYTGEGAPISRKGACPAHSRDVERTFHGAHVTINARSDADLNVQAIMQKVAKSSGANYSAHKEQERPEYSNTPQGAVGTTYKNAYQSEGAASTENRNKFWQAQQAEEEERKKREVQARAEERKKIDEERRKREEQAEHNRIDQERQRQEQVNATKAKQPVPLPAATKAAIPPPQPKANVVSEVAKVEQEEHARVEEVQEDRNAAAQHEVEHQHHQVEQQQAEDEWKDEAPVEEDSQPGEVISETQEETLTAKALYDYQATEEGELTFNPDDIITNIVKLDEGWWQGTLNGNTGLFPANYVELI